MVKLGHAMRERCKQMGWENESEDLSRVLGKTFGWFLEIASISTGNLQLSAEGESPLLYLLECEAFFNFFCWFVQGWKYSKFVSHFIRTPSSQPMSCKLEDFYHPSFSGFVYWQCGSKSKAGNTSEPTRSTFCNCLNGSLRHALQQSYVIRYNIFELALLHLSIIPWYIAYYKRICEILGPKVHILFWRLPQLRKMTCY